MPRPRKEKVFATNCPHTDRIAHCKDMCKSCYNQSKRSPEALARANSSEATKAAKQRYEDKNREKRNAQRREYARGNSKESL